MATDQAPQRRPALFRAGSRRRSSTSTSKPVSRGQNAADTAAATLSVPPTPTTVASSLSAQRGSTRRRSSWLSVISEASTSAPTVLDSVPATPTVANGVFSGPPKRSAPKSSVPLVFYSLCLGTDASPEQHWHCSLCRKCSPVDSHHCPSCNQCVYVPGSSSLPQFRPAASAIAAAEREAELDDLQCESATVSPYTPHLTTPARTVRIADEVTESREASESTARTSPNRRRALASLRTGLRSSVHFSPCPTCAVSVPTGIPSDHPAADMLRAPEGYVAAVPWVTDAWVDWMAERASPDDMDAVIADAQAVLPRLVYDGGLGGARAYEDGTSSSDPHGRAHGWTLEEVVWGSSSGESDSDSDDGDADDGSRTVEFAPRAVMMGTPPPTTPSRPATPSMSPAGPIFALPLNAQALPSLLHHPSPLLPPPPPIPTTAATMPSSPVPRGVSSTISNATGSLVSSASSSSLSDQRSVISAAREWEPLELAPGVIAYQTVAPTT
ncbi:hypothetical protein BC828DRAFT_207712 [Blastocladiella britannica]|nr:hypothetical protein BC828DRAFT_207712 [Blastocladiella britannica]